MQAIRIHEYGGTDVLKHENVTTPVPTDDEVRLQVRAAGVNPVDCKRRQGAAVPVDFPWIPGLDVAGVVDDVGANVTEFEPGDEVYGAFSNPSDSGGYAEAVTMSPTNLVRKPRPLSFEKAAGVPLAALTAWQVLEATDVGVNTRILVHAAAGGVGHFTVQLAKQRGAHVIGTASGSNEELLRELGVDEFVNYREQRFEEVLEPVDVVVDAIGGETFDRSLEITKPGGRIENLPRSLTAGQKQRANDNGVRAVKTPGGEWEREWFESISERIQAGTVTPVVDTVFPLANARNAHERSENGHVCGKLVLKVSG